MPGLLERIRVAFTPGVRIEDVGGDDVATPFKDIGEAILTKPGGLAERGIMTRRMREAQAEAAAADAVLLGDSMLQFGGLINQLQTTAETPEALNSINAITTQFDIGTRLWQSEDPELAERGRAIAQQALQNTHGVAQQMEVLNAQRDAEEAAQQRLAQDRSAAADQAKFDLDIQNAREYRDTISGPRNEQMAQFDQAFNFMKTGDRLGFEFGFKSAIQAIDNSVVRPDELTLAGGSSGMATALIDRFNRAQGKITGPLREELTRQLLAMRDAHVQRFDRDTQALRGHVAAYGGNWELVSGSDIGPPEITEEDVAQASAEDETDPTTVEKISAIASTATSLLTDAANSPVGSAIATGAGIGLGGGAMLRQAQRGAVTQSMLSRLRRAPAAIALPILRRIPLLAAVMGIADPSDVATGTVAEPREGETMEEFIKRLNEAHGTNTVRPISVRPQRVPLPTN